MRLQALLMAAGIAPAEGLVDPEVRFVTEDSRRVQPGALFVAIPGTNDDGLRHVADALDRGAVAVAAPVRPRDLSVPFVHAKQPRVALAALARVLCGDPGSRLELTAVTGTKGKTTTAYLVRAVSRAAGRATGLIGTVEIIAAATRHARLTTPPAPEIQELLAEMVRNGFGSAVLEVSSHAIDQARVHGLRFETAIFTNLSPDHLDYHSNVESYFATKARLFVGEEAARRVVVNVDDAFGRRLVAERPDALLYGSTGDVRSRSARATPEGLLLTAETPSGVVEIRSRLLGLVNVDNLLAALAWGLARGLEPDVMVRGLEAQPPVPGRLERVPNDAGVLAVVDFAHTGPALAAALQSLREITGKRLIVVFGAGGNRDPERRRTMGEVAARLADVAVITSDNPRDEDPLAIVAAIESAASRADGRAEQVVEPDRAAAIARAVQLAGEGDTLLVAGKGHERFQIIGSERRPFDDRQVMTRAFAARAGAD